MLTSIPQVAIQSLGVNAISIGQIAVGPIKIGQLVINDFELNTAADGAFLRNLVVSVTYNMKLDWKLHIELPGKTIDDSGTEDLDSPEFIVGFGDVRVPGFENLKIDIATLEAPNVAATVDPITNLQLAAASADQVQASNVKLPTAGFGITGLGFGPLKVAGVGVPAAGLDSLTIGHVQGDAFPLGQMAISNLGLPSASVPDIVSQGVDVTGTPKPKAFHLDLGVLDLVLRVNPVAEAKVDQLVIRNVKASTSLGKITLNNVVAPYELLNLTLGQIGLNNISIPTISIA